MSGVAGLRSALERDGYAMVRAAQIVDPRPAMAAAAAFMDGAAAGGVRRAPGGLVGYFPPASERALGSDAPDDKEYLQARAPEDLPRELAVDLGALLVSSWDLAQSVAAEIGLAGLGIDVDYRLDRSGVLRVVRYGRSGGAAGHTDITLFTLLLGETGPAVGVTAPDGSERALALQPGVAAVLAGDMLELATNGAIRACRHQVAPVAHRCSVLFFANPSDGTWLRPGLQAGAALKRRLAEVAQ